jgi:hypothetical protein
MEHKFKNIRLEYGCCLFELANGQDVEAVFVMEHFETTTSSHKEEPDYIELPVVTGFYISGDGNGGYDITGIVSPDVFEFFNQKIEELLKMGDNE